MGEAIQGPPEGPRSARNDATSKSVAELAAAGLLDPARAQALRAVEARYSVAVTPEIVALIDPADPADPIARQFLPICASWRRARRSAPIRSATTPSARQKASCIATRTACC